MFPLRAADSEVRLGARLQAAPDPYSGGDQPHSCAQVRVAPRPGVKRISVEEETRGQSQNKEGN